MKTIRRFFWFLQERKLALLALLGIAICVGIGAILFAYFSSQKANRIAFDYMFAMQKMERFQKADATKTLEGIFVENKGLYAVLAGRDLFGISIKNKQYADAMDILDAMPDKAINDDMSIIVDFFVGSSLSEMKNDKQISYDVFVSKSKKIISLVEKISISSSEMLSMREEFVASMYLEMDDRVNYESHIKRAYHLNHDNNRLKELVQNL